MAEPVAVEFTAPASSSRSTAYSTTAWRTRPTRRVTHTAVPRLYAEMVAKDRRLRLAGYEIYRFGGFELTAPGGEQILAAFFTELLGRHRKPPL
ncbi:hypothetical protein Save01_08194 [Streptomyces avermitilis]